MKKILFLLVVMTTISISTYAFSGRLASCDGYKQKWINNLNLSSIKYDLSSETNGKDKWGFAKVSIYDNKYVLAYAELSSKGHLVVKPISGVLRKGSKKIKSVRLEVSGEYSSSYALIPFYSYAKVSW